MEEVLSVIDNGQNLVEFLLSQQKKDLCSLNVKKLKLLGEGVYGKVYEYEYNRKNYALKESSTEIFYEENKNNETLEEIANSYDWDDFIKNVFYKLNGGNKNAILSNFISPGEEYSSYINCNYGDYKYKRFDTKEKIILKSPYLCDSNQYSEFVIGVLCSMFYKRNQSIHFVDIINYGVCISRGKKLRLYDYILMEKIDSNLNQIFDCLWVKDYIMPSFFVQLFHSIYVYQTLKINHNDLHTGNIFIKYVENDTEFNGKKLVDNEYFHYQIGNKNIYTPFIPFIIKIGDLGLSFKYSDPVIGDKEIIDTGYQPYGFPIYSPNWFSKCNDIIVVMTKIFIKCASKKDTFIKNITKKVLGDAINTKEKLNPSKINIEIGRPKIETLEDNFGHITPEKLLFDKDIFPKSFYEKPSGRIITLGKI